MIKNQFSQSFSSKSNSINQFLSLIRKILFSNVIRSISFYVSLIMSLAIITICLFWPTTAYEVIMGDEIKLLNDLTFKAQNLQKYTLMTGIIEKSPKSKFSQKKSIDLSVLNGYGSRYCGEEKKCEIEIFEKSMPLANNAIYLSDKSNVFYAVYQDSNKEKETFLLLRVPFHHTFQLKHLINDLMPFKIFLDNYVIGILNSSKLNQHKIEYGIKIIASNPNYLSKQSINPLTQFSAGVIGAHAYLGLSVMVIHMSACMVQDKEMELRSLMSIMGMNRIPYVFAYFAVYSSVILFLAFYGTIIIVIEPKLINKILRTSMTFFMIFLNYITVGLLILAQGFLLSTLTKSVRIVTFIVLLVQCLQMIVGMTVLKFHLEDTSIKSDFNWINYIFPVIAFFTAQIELSTNTSVTGLNPMPGRKILFILFMTFFTFIVAFYLDYIIDTGTGHSFPWYFPIVGIKRLFIKKERKKMYSYYNNTQINNEEYFTEEVNQDLVRVRLMDIEKRFVKTVCCKVNEVRAVQNLTIDLQEGMITAILGHNGAGKTTTFNMLVGLLHASSGKMRIYGLNPDNPWDKTILNQITSICMQKDILIPNMTCMEHLQLFGVIKRLEKKEILLEANKLFHLLEFTKEKHKRINILSGGQLRKLCVAIALLGDPKIVILDEPTSGVDPISRRSIWNALKAYKHNRVLILSTHYMDEADILADWKAIMVKGQVVCYGTSMFLKRKFNLGYVLNCTLRSNEDDVTNLINMVKLQAPSSEFQKRYGMEVTFKVLDAEIVELCQFMSSEEGILKLKNIGVLDYGISVTKLEEIFLKLGEIEVDDSMHQDENFEGILKKKLKLVTSKDSNNDISINLSKIAEKALLKKPHNFIIGFSQFLTFVRLNILLTIRSPIFAMLRTIGPFSAAALAAVLFWFESTRAKNFEATGRNLSMISSPWPPYIIYNFLKHKNENLSGNEFYQDLLCIRRMYGGRFIFTNKSDIVRNIIGSTHIQIIKWNNIDGYKLDFIYDASFKEGLYHIFLFQTLLQNCFINRIIEVDLTKEIKFFIIVDTWNIKWVDSGHPSFPMLSAFVYLMALSVAFNLMNPVISGDVVRDRILGNLAQMTLYGLKYMSYWASHFLLHFLHYFEIMCIIIVFMCMVNNYLFYDPAYAFIFALIFCFAAVDTILAIYSISIVFEDIVAAEISLSFSILIPMFLMSVFVFCPLNIMKIMHITFVFLFPFLDPWLTLMFIDFKTRQQRHFVYDALDAPYVMPFKNIIYYNPVINSIIIHIIHIIVLSTFFIGYNWYTFVFKRRAHGQNFINFFRRLRSTARSQTSISTTMEGFAMGANEDLIIHQGVVEEILETENNTGNVRLAVGDLTKIYHTIKTFIPREIESNVALSNVSLIVNSGEVFGLLGPSGAGKTTVMNCIAQLLQPSTGKIIVYDKSNNVFIPAAEAFSKNLIGLCPQSNPIWPNLTVREHLLLYAALRGVSRKSRNSHSTNLIKLVHLKKYTNSLSESLSGGCKRRLSMAISFTGHPDLILLDEPSCGVDPKSRRNLWDTISSVIHNTEKGAVITSQFMEECEALCNRLGIIVNGRIVCIGSPQELKSKFGRGISVDIKITPGADANSTFVIKSNLTSYLLDFYPKLLTIENFGERLTYRIPKSPDITFGSVFKVIHEAKIKFEIEDYAVSQPTLEQVYFDFAKYQTKDDLKYDVQIFKK